MHVNARPRLLNRLHPKSLPLLLALLLAAALTGCSRQPAAPEQPPLELSIMLPLHLIQPPSDELVAELEKMTGTDLDLRWVPDEIYSDKLSLAVASGSYMKATYVNFNEYQYMKNAIRLGHFWEIGPYLWDYPNLRKLSSLVFEESAVDDQIYGLYAERPASRQGIILRQDWLDRLGLEPPGTLEELYEVLRAFTEDDPDGNGQDDTFGLADRNDLIYGAFKTLGSYFGTPNNWGLIGGQIVPEFETDAYMETMKFMKRLYDEGLINRDFAVTSKQNQRTRFVTGAAGVYIGSMADAQRLADSAVALDPQAAFTLVNRIQGPAGLRVWAMPGYGGMFLFSKSAVQTKEELHQILAFFDRSMDADVSNMMRYGFEGRHHERADGEVVLPPEQEQLRVDEVNAMHTLMIGELSNPNLLPIAELRPLAELAETLIKDNTRFVVRDATANLESARDDESGLELQGIITDATYNFMLGYLDEQGFRREVQRWKDSGGARIIEEYNASYQQFRGSQ
ncbi:extracellular solute-binding protein [Paenibacillus sp. IB182496]|uniref:Extracellular solute-binding protein n=1 Tax=Paenibacillus sabuli TaxID=2772509 RepID=A0A927BTK7_9BACL|nr:extracellular solute-binding protein [Paenibacillus sabuli]MBD2845525.1 extracellular solute-binding protein [Paenibacillus sabuli]